MDYRKELTYKKHEKSNKQSGGSIFDFFNIGGTPNNFRLVKTLKGLKTADCLAITPDGKKIVAGSNETLGDRGNIIMWNINTGDKLKELNGHTERVLGIAITPDGTKIISGSADETIRIWDINTGNELKVLRGHTDGIKGIAITPDGSNIVSGSFDNTIMVWDIESGDQLKIFSGHTDDINSVAITPDGSKIVSGSSDSTIRVWDIESGNQLQMIKGIDNEEFYCVTITSDGKKIVSGSSDKVVRVWDLAVGHMREQLGSPFDKYGVVYSVVSTPTTQDDEYIIVGYDNGYLIIWSYESGLEVKELNNRNDTMQFRSVLVTPDGQKVIASAGYDSIKIWDISDLGVRSTMMRGDSNQNIQQPAETQFDEMEKKYNQLEREFNKKQSELTKLIQKRQKYEIRLNKAINLLNVLEGGPV